MSSIRRTPALVVAAAATLCLSPWSPPRRRGPRRRSPRRAAPRSPCLAGGITSVEVRAIGAGWRRLLPGGWWQGGFGLRRSSRCSRVSSCSSASVGPAAVAPARRRPAAPRVWAAAEPAGRASPTEMRTAVGVAAARRWSARARRTSTACWWSRAAEAAAPTAGPAVTARAPPAPTRQAGRERRAVVARAAPRERAGAAAGSGGTALTGGAGGHGDFTAGQLAGRWRWRWRVLRRRRRRRLRLRSSRRGGRRRLELRHPSGDEHESADGELERAQRHVRLSGSGAPDGERLLAGVGRHLHGRPIGGDELLLRRGCRQPRARVVQRLDRHHHDERRQRASGHVDHGRPHLHGDRHLQRRAHQHDVDLLHGPGAADGEHLLAGVGWHLRGRPIGGDELLLQRGRGESGPRLLCRLGRHHHEQWWHRASEHVDHRRPHLHGERDLQRWARRHDVDHLYGRGVPDGVHLLAGDGGHLRGRSSGADQLHVCRGCERSGARVV